MKLKSKKEKNELLKPGTRQCTSCKQTFPLTEEYFHKNKQQPWELHIYCKECRNKQRKVQYLSEKAIRTAKRKIRKDLTDKCFFCDTELKLKEFKDNYDNTFFICKECYDDKRHRIQWKKSKRRWFKSDSLEQE